MSENSSNYKGLAIAALICGIIGLFCNSCYLVGLAAIIMGGIALAKHTSSTGMAVAGLVLGVLSTVYHITFDVIFTICTLGGGIFTVFI